jgi:hypothetical protein
METRRYLLHESFGRDHHIGRLEEKTMTSPRDATILFIACLAMILPRDAFASVVVNLENSADPGTRKIDVLPGQTFWIDVNVDMDRQIFGVACRLAASESVRHS